uniref:Uncharacterized protein n=1 Tax=Romanomermis culicivorax TaxID=13658 RepID=A0A915IIF4_ROMCU
MLDVGHLMLESCQRKPGNVTASIDVTQAYDAQMLKRSSVTDNEKWLEAKNGKENLQTTPTDMFCVHFVYQGDT